MDMRNVIGLLAGRFSGTVGFDNAEYASDENAASGLVPAEGLSIAVSPPVHVVAVGDFETSVDFGDGSIPSAGQGDVFVLSLHE